MWPIMAASGVDSIRNDSASAEGIAEKTNWRGQCSPTQVAAENRGSTPTPADDEAGGNARRLRLRLRRPAGQQGWRF